MVLIRKYIISIALLLSGYLLFSQQAVNNQVKAFKAYQSVWAKQKLHLSFNQDKYAPGDTIYFKALLFDQDFKLWSGIQMVEAYLLNTEGQVVKSIIFKTENGLGYNQLVLDSDVNEGFYNLGAFTNWMRNFGAQSMFQYSLMVVKENEILKENVPLQAAVEGGRLIDGLSSKVVIKTNEPEARVYLLNQSQQLIDSLKTDAMGFGSLKLLAQLDVDYSVKVEGGNELLKLPKVEMQGYKISLKPILNKEKDLTFTIEGKGSAGTVNLIVSSDSEVFYSESLIMTTESRSVSIPVPDTGLYYVSLLDQSGQLWSSRTFYVPEKSSDLDVKLQVSPSNWQPRSAMTLDFQFSDVESQAYSGEFSISVVNTEATTFSPSSNLKEEILLNSIVEGDLLKIEDENTRLSAIDHSLVLNVKPLPWGDILSKPPVRPAYDYSSLFQLRGLAINSETDEPIPANSTLMFYLQKDLMRYEVPSRNRGRFDLNMLDVYGQDEVLMMAETRKGEEILDIKVDWIELPLPDLEKGDQFVSNGTKDGYAIFKQKQAKVEKSYGFFSGSGNLDSLAETKKNRAAQVPILETENEINVEDFYVFPTMKQFVKEVVRPLRVGTDNGKDIVRMKFLEPGIENDPLYIIDGIATKSTAYFLSLNPKELQTISVIKNPRKLSRIGLIAKNGVVVVNSKTGNLREPVDPNKLIFGLSQSTNFDVLDADWANSSRVPEFRSTVYWNPNVEIDESGRAKVEFYTSDDVAPLQIKIEGLVNGKPFKLLRTIELSNSNNY